jgi:phospholipid/cholesterol/gamma-HCH transport system substrate-binding protein
MRITRRVLINSIGFLVLASILSAVFAVQILPTVFGDTYSIFGTFESAGGVFTNQEVTYRGLQVGRVGSMTLTREAVKIEMVIDSDFDRIPREGTNARILFKSAVGEQFIDLLPETDQAPFLQSGDEIPLERTSVPIQTEDLLRNLDAVLASLDPTALSTVIEELAVGLGGHGQDLKQLLLALDTLSQIGAERRELIASGLRAGADVQDAFNRTGDDFVRAAESLAVVAEVLARRRAEFGSTLQDAQVLDRELIALLNNSRDEINQVIADLAVITRITHSQREDLDLALEFLGPMLEDIHRAYAAPYFMFNFLANNEAPSCSYSPSSRPVRPVTDDSFKEPVTNFRCPASFDPQSTEPAGLATEPSGLAAASGEEESAIPFPWIHLQLEGR